jgi:Arc/MetJ-type ribon-helix-helix transcriptional regulator
MTSVMQQGDTLRMAYKPPGENGSKMPRVRKEQFYVRLNRATEERIEGYVEAGEYASVSDFIVAAIYWFLNEEDYHKKRKVELLDFINADPDIQEALRKANEPP